MRNYVFAPCEPFSPVVRIELICFFCFFLSFEYLYIVCDFDLWLLIIIIIIIIITIIIIIVCSMTIL